MSDDLDWIGRVHRLEIDGVQEPDIVERPIEHRKTGDKILYRAIVRSTSSPLLDEAIFGGTVVCRTHLIELRMYPASRQRKFRALGYRERHAIDTPECQMCKATVAHGNVCYNDDCARPLHPQWPAVYCSNECALEGV